MTSSDIIRIARRRAGISQQQLAHRSGIPRETIARWESGVHEPSFAALSRAVEACDLDLVTYLARRDRSLDEAVADQLALSPRDRLTILPRASRAEAGEELRWLGNARTPTVLIGDVAAALQGAPQRPRGSGAEFVSSDPLAIAQEMEAAGLVPVDAEERWRDVYRLEPWTLPGGGTLSIASNVPGTKDFADLRRDAVRVTVEPGLALLVAHPRDLLRIADASPQAADRARIAGLRALLAATREQAQPAS